MTPGVFVGLYLAVGFVVAVRVRLDEPSVPSAFLFLLWPALVVGTVIAKLVTFASLAVDGVVDPIVEWIRRSP